MNLTKKQAAEEYLRRKKARKSLIDFTRYTYPRYRPAEHHCRMGVALEAVLAGEIDRLMIKMPPRHGKSELVSRRFPAFTVGTQPEQTFISGSYNKEFADDFGAEVREIVSSQKYRNLFPEIELSKDTAAKGHWRTNKGGAYVAAGIGSAVTGRGAGIFNIDDPVKDREDADSQRMRDRAYKWYCSTAYTRLEADIQYKELDDDWLWDDVNGALKEGLVKPWEGAIVLTQTPWHDDDLCARLIRDMENGGDQWHVINMPSESTRDGKIYALWPEKFNFEKLQRIRRAIGEREYNSLYLLDPTPDEGAFYRREWFKRYHLKDLPDNVNKYGTSDFAVSENDGDFTEHTIFNIDAEDDTYIGKNWHGQTAADVWIDTLLDLHEEHRTSGWFGEGGVIRKAVEPFLNKRMQERRLYPRIEWINPIHNKVISARSFQGRASQGKVYIPYGPEGDRMIEQLVKFPQGKFDDFCDTCSLWGRALDDTSKVVLPINKKDDKVRRYNFNKGKHKAGKLHDAR